MSTSGRDERDRIERWVREHSRAVCGFLAAMLRDHARAEDLTQEVFVRAWQARSRYADQGTERRYLLRIASRLAHDEVRRRRRSTLPIDREGGFDPPDGRATPLEAIEAREADVELAQALDRLTEPQRQTLLLRYYGQLEYHEIARTLGCPLGTVLSHARRGLVALRRMFVEETR